MSTWLTVENAAEFLKSGTGRGIRIALLDSGVEWSHPQLASLNPADDLAIVEKELQLAVQPGDGHDVYGHGTAIAGILHRLAPEAEIGSFRVLGERLRSRSAIIREAVQQALDRGYHIISCSFGSGRMDQVLQYKDWIDQAYIKGRHIVAACNNVDATRREWPGHFPTVITVNFMDSTNGQDLYFRPGSLVEFLAPGRDLEVAWLQGGIKKVTGSSFAVPHVTALLARMISQCPELPPLQAKALLHRLARPWGGSEGVME